MLATERVRSTISKVRSSSSNERASELGEYIGKGTGTSQHRNPRLSPYSISLTIVGP